MKKLIALLLALIMALSLCACGGNAGSTGDAENSTTIQESKSDESSRIELKGTFILEPSEQLDLSGEGLDPVQRYLVIVYDVLSSDSENETLSGRNDSVTVTMNDTNTYDQLSKYDGKVLRGFRENCGYAISTSYETLWGGSDPVRMIAAFAINGNDIKNDCTAKFEFQLSNNLKASIDVVGTDIQTINWLDGIFAVEENPDAYQVAHLVKNRAEICKGTLELGAQENRNGKFTSAKLRFTVCGVLWQEIEEIGGYSCGGTTTLTPELPAFNIESVRLYYPEIADKIEIIQTNIAFLNEELEKDKPDYDKTNSAYFLADDTLGEIIDYFESN